MSIIDMQLTAAADANNTASLSVMLGNYLMMSRVGKSSPSRPVFQGLKSLAALPFLKPPFQNTSKVPLPYNSPKDQNATVLRVFETI